MNKVGGGAVNGQGYGTVTGRYMSNYQKIQFEKTRTFMENQAKQMHQLEREKELLLGGTHL